MLKNIQNQENQEKTRLKKDYPKLIKSLTKLVWDECKRIIKIRFGNVCFTCGKTCKKSNRHTGHLFAKAWCGFRMKFDLRILATQCYYCNINLGGNGAEFSENFIRDNGLSDFLQIAWEVEQSKKEKWTPEKKVLFLEEKLREYKLITV